MVAASRGQGSLIGATLGDYEVQALIGRGASGTVYLARDVKLNRHVALKVLLGSLARSAASVRQFQLEAQTAAPLDHPNVVRVYSAGIEKGTPYMAMEFVDGEPLDQFLRRKGRLKWQRAFHIVSQVALALDCAHRSKVIHRDVKPSNIMLDKQGRVRLTDFGIARIQSDESSTRGGSGGNFIGTPQYMSPEQCSGGEITVASDVFSLGVVAFQMIAGELPFRGESSAALIKSICAEEPPRLSKVQQGVPDDVARLVAYMMEKKAERRPANARVVDALVTRLQEQKGGVSAVPSALDSFIKEETEPRPFSSAHRVGALQAGKKTTRVGGRSFSRKTIHRVAFVGVLALMALSITPLVSTFARSGSAAPASALNLAYFTEGDHGALVAHCFADGYFFEHLSWIGDRSVLLVEAKGIAGTLASGGRGLIAIDPAERSLASVRPPAGPALDPDYSRGRVPGLTQQVIPPMPLNSPLRDAILVQARASRKRPVLLLAQRWDRATPNPAVLYEAEVDSWAPQSAFPSEVSEPSRVVMKPDGHTVCLVLYDAESNSHYLAERRIGERPRTKVGRRLTTALARIIPESVQYTSSGDALLYLRDARENRRELWKLSLDGSEVDGEMLVDELAGETFSQSPFGRYIAVQKREAGGEMRVALLTTGEVSGPEDLGRGTLSADAWLPTGKGVLVMRGPADDAQDGASQLYSVSPRMPHETTQVTYVREGLRGAYAVSRDGEWVAATVANEKTPTVVFVRLMEVIPESV